MRLDEILSSNQVIITLKNMKINFTNEFNFIKETHTFMLAAKIGSHRHRPLLDNVQSLKKDIKPFLEYNFDPDPDIDLLKNDAMNILKQLDKIENEIP